MHNPEQSGTELKFAKVLAQATRVFGSQEEAKLWMSRRAVGLDGRRPVDLLATADGAAEVETFLGRILYGVYV